MLLKVLLCQKKRRASRDMLIDALWTEDEQRQMKDVRGALKSTAVVLREVLRIAGEESLLMTLTASDELMLAEQQRIWVDADAFEQLVNLAMRATGEQEALQQWELAHALVQGEFLAEDRYSDWAKTRRETLQGKAGECVYALADLYVKQQRPDRAREVLWDQLEAYPTDQDALFRLMTLLEQQQRYHAAWQLYKRAREAITKDDLSLTPRTHAVAKRIREKLMTQELPPPVETAIPLDQSGIYAVSPHVQLNKTAAISLAVTNQSLTAESSKKHGVINQENDNLLFPDIPPMLLESVVLQSTVEAYEDVLALAWEAFYTSSAQRAANTVAHWLLHLTLQINTFPGMADQLIEQRCRFLQLDSVISRDRTDFVRAFNAINEAITLAFQLKNAELVASSLYRRAKIWLAQQKYELASQDLEHALPYAQRSRNPLRCYILMLLAETYSHFVRDDKQNFKKSFILLDEVDQAVRSHGVLEGDGSYVKVDTPGLYMIRGDVLRRSGQFQDARKALDIVRENLPKEFTRWQGNLLFSEASLALAEHDVSSACQYGFDALEIARATDSRSGETKVHRLYRDIYKIEPSHPHTKELGARLGLL
jgi:DNA-binding SARP family transcriptional activator